MNRQEDKDQGASNRVIVDFEGARLVHDSSNACFIGVHPDFPDTVVHYPESSSGKPTRENATDVTYLRVGQPELLTLAFPSTLFRTYDVLDDEDRPIAKWPVERQIYQGANGQRVEVLKMGDQVEFAQQGGGFVCRMPRAEFDAIFALAPTPEFSLVNITADWLPDEVTLQAYSDGTRWNGWAMPCFTREVALQLTALMPIVRYDEARDAFVATIDEDEEELFRSRVVRVGNQEVITYPIGSGSWCWEELDLTSAECIGEYLQACGFQIMSTGGEISAWGKSVAADSGTWLVLVADSENDSAGIRPDGKIAVVLRAPGGGSGPEAKHEVLANADALPDALRRFREAGEEMFGIRAG